jgi:Flp pilus assembly protein TadB
VSSGDAAATADDTLGMEPKTLHERLESRIGVDVRLFYGLLIPAAVVVAGVVALTISPTWWLLAPLVLLLVAATGIVVAGIGQMLSE